MLPNLFSPYSIKGTTLKNRIVVSPMSQYRAKDGFANDWHFVHLGRFALGGAGLVFCEATAVSEIGRRTHGDLGLWSDEQIAPLKRVTEFLNREGSVAGVQLAHAGRKASERRPWHGETPVDDEDSRVRNETPWTAIAPSALPYADGWPMPREMSEKEIEEVVQEFGTAARRSVDAGFKVVEIYAAHGFLIHQFLSPISNQRTDCWGGSLENRMQLALNVAESVRRNIPEDMPLIFRLSSTDWLDGGIEIDDVVAVSKALKKAGVDIIDCSSGGIGGKERPGRMTVEQGFQAPFAKQIKEQAEMATMTVGFLWDPEYCDELIASGCADLIALAREILDDPNWPLHAQNKLTSGQPYTHWPEEYGWWLSKRQRLIDKLKLR